MRDSYEKQDFAVRKATKVGIATLLILALLALGLLILQKMFTPSPSERHVVFIPENSPGDAAEFELGRLRTAKAKRDREKIHSFGWVDKKTVRVPIERAMRDLAKHKRWDLKP